MMMRTILASAFSLAVAAWSSAHACSTYSSNAQIYPAISGYGDWEESELSVGLVYVSDIQSQNRVVPKFPFDDKPREKLFIEVEYALIENISGDFVLDKKQWAPALSEVDIDQELALKKSGRGFAYWDRRDLGGPIVYGYDGFSSCGANSSLTPLPNQYYLQFKRNTRTVGMEIISGPKDPFVEDWRQIFSDSLTSKIKRRPKSYFQEMAGYQEIELKTCPTEEEVDSLNSDAKTGDADLGPLSAANLFKQYASHNSKIESLKIIDLNAYQNSLTDDYYAGDNDWTDEDNWQCEAGSRFLVLDKISSKIDRRHIDIEARDETEHRARLPQHRYLEIKNGNVDTKGILSHITILPSPDGNTEVSVAQVKNWIREANPN